MRRMGEQLGMPGPFADGSHDDVYAIVRTCEAHEEQGTALAALAAAMKDLHPNCDALARLEDCDAALKGLTALSMDQLVPVLDVIADMSPEYGYADFHELARQAAFGKAVPLRGAKDLPGIVHKLNGARESTPARAPWSCGSLPCWPIRWKTMTASGLRRKWRISLTGLGFPWVTSMRTWLGRRSDSLWKDSSDTRWGNISARIADSVHHLRGGFRCAARPKGAYRVVAI